MNEPITQEELDAWKREFWPKSNSNIIPRLISEVERLRGISEMQQRLFNATLEQRNNAWEELKNRDLAHEIDQATVKQIQEKLHAALAAIRGLSYKFEENRSQAAFFNYGSDGIWAEAKRDVETAYKELTDEKETQNP